MREGDFIAVIAYDLRPEILVDFTQDKGEVVQALQRLNYPAFSESNLYDTVADTLDRLEEVQGKVAMILISSGIDTFSKINLGEMLKRTKKTNVAIYPVALGGNFLARNDQYLEATTRLDFLQAESTLKSFAKFTGGQAYFPRFTSAFPDIFQTIAAVLRSQYTLSYVSTNPTKDSKYRRIQVDVTADVDGDGKPDKLKINH
jgi:VWFA-related protein